MNSQWKEDGKSASVTKYTIVEDPPHDSEALTYLVVQSLLNCFCTDKGTYKASVYKWGLTKSPNSLLETLRPGTT